MKSWKISKLTTETREQILRHVSERERKAKVQTMKKWTKYLSVAACCALVVGAAYGIHTLHPDKTVSEEEDMTTTESLIIMLSIKRQVRL